MRVYSNDMEVGYQWFRPRIVGGRGKWVKRTLGIFKGEGKWMKKGRGSVRGRGERREERTRTHPTNPRPSTSQSNSINSLTNSNCYILFLVVLVECNKELGVHCCY